jgi:acyl-CoA reductase-like NAD-dependent aldehyde dehydrogenase
MSKVIEIQNFIDGKFIKSDHYFNSYNPSTDQINALIPDSNANEVNKAVIAAKQAFQS